MPAAPAPPGVAGPNTHNPGRTRYRHCKAPPRKGKCINAMPAATVRNQIRRVAPEKNQGGVKNTPQVRANARTSIQAEVQCAAPSAKRRGAKRNKSATGKARKK